MRGQQQQPSGSLDFLYIIIIIVAAGLLAWWKASDAILHAIYTIRVWEMSFVFNAVHWARELTQDWLVSQTLMDSVTDEYSRILAINAVGDYSQLTYKDMLSDSQVVGQFLVYPILVIGLIGIFVVFKFNTAYKFRRRYDMRSLLKAELVNWPPVQVVARLDLVKQDIDKGPWAMSDTPLMFAHRHDLLKRTIKENKPAVELRKDSARRIFALQMGPMWEGLQKLPTYTQALFAIFAARGEEDAAGAEALMRHIQLSAGQGKISFGNYYELLAKHVKSKKIGRILGPHAYVLTIMASMLEYARTTGVFACSEFLWLKPIDRRLWFMLNNVGRQTAFIDCAGPYSHWLIERRLRRPLKVPMVEMAVVALHEAVEEVLFNPDEDEI